MSFRVTILGTSGAVPAYDRLPSAQLIEINSKKFLIDCGEGTQFLLLKLHTNFNLLNHIFISHLHGDHYLGLVGLIFTMHMKDRRKDLHLYGYRGLDEIITTQLKHARSALNFKLIFHELKEWLREEIYSDDKISVETIPLRHKLPCSGFLIREKEKPRKIIKEKIPKDITFDQLNALKKGEDIVIPGKGSFPNEDLTHAPRHSCSYAYCSDTAYDERIISQLTGIDLLYHEATFTEGHQSKAKETLHSTAKDAATIAAKAGVKQLLIGHFSARYKETDDLLAEAKSIFSNTIVAREGDIIEIDE